MIDITKERLQQLQELSCRTILGGVKHNASCAGSQTLIEPEPEVLCLTFPRWSCNQAHAACWGSVMLWQHRYSSYLWLRGVPQISDCLRYLGMVMLGHQGVVSAHKSCGTTAVVQLVQCHVSGAACHPLGAVAVRNDFIFWRWLPPECRCFGLTLLLISSESLSLLTSAMALRLDMT